MSVTLDHPLVADYLRRLEFASVSLPVQRRSELIEEIRDHLREALAAADGETQVRMVLDRLGTPEEIVAAEAPSREPVAGEQVSAFSPSGSTGSSGPAGAPASAPARPPSPWGPLEIMAVVGLTVGFVVVPVIGPLFGAVCACLSTAWTRREKTVAVVFAALPAVLVVVGFLAVFMVSTGPTETTGAGGAPGVERVLPESAPSAPLASSSAVSTSGE